MNYRVEAYFDNVTAKLSDVKMTMILEEDKFKKFEKLTDEEKQQELKEKGYLTYRHLEVKEYGNGIGLSVKEKEIVQGNMY